MTKPKPSPAPLTPHIDKALLHLIAREDDTGRPYLSEPHSDVMGPDSRAIEYVTDGAVLLAWPSCFGFPATQPDTINVSRVLNSAPESSRQCVLGELRAWCAEPLASMMPCPHCGRSGREPTSRREHYAKFLKAKHKDELLKELGHGFIYLDRDVLATALAPLLLPDDATVSVGFTYSNAVVSLRVRHVLYTDSPAARALREVLIVIMPLRDNKKAAPDEPDFPGWGPIE